MAYQIIEGKEFTWWHFSHLEDADFDVLREKFLFHPLDFDDLREDTELTKLDAYKHYLFAVFNIPVFDAQNEKISKQNLAMFIGKDYVVTVTKYSLESVDRFFARAQRSSGLRRDALGKATGYFLYKLLEYIYRDVKVILREIVRETEVVERDVYDQHTRVTTTRLGVLRRNVLFLRHVVEPHKITLDQFRTTGKAFVPASLHLYFDDLRDLLNSLSVVIDNVVNIVDGLFDVNESFLSHRTNDSIRFLTIVSVVLMPPTLVTSYYGMNVDGLPFNENIVVVSLVVLISLLAVSLWLVRIDRKK